MNATIISKWNFSGDFNSAYMNKKIEINVSCKHQMHKDLIKRKLSTWAALFIVNVTMAYIRNLMRYETFTQKLII